MEVREALLIVALLGLLGKSVFDAGVLEDGTSGLLILDVAFGHELLESLADICRYLLEIPIFCGYFLNNIVPF